MLILCDGFPPRSSSPPSNPTFPSQPLSSRKNPSKIENMRNFVGFWQHSLILMWSFPTKNILKRPLHQLGLKPHKWTSLRAHHGLPYPRSKQNVKLWGMENKSRKLYSWWFNQPTWKIYVKLGIFHQAGVKLNIFETNHIGWCILEHSPLKFHMSPLKNDENWTTPNECNILALHFPSLIIVKKAKLQFFWA